MLSIFLIKEGTEPDLVMLIENMDWIYTPEIDGISYDEDGTYAITREKGTESSVLGFSDGTLEQIIQKDLS